MAMVTNNSIMVKPEKEWYLGFENVNIYPLVAEILGLKYDKKSIDGKFEVLRPILKQLNYIIISANKVKIV